MSSYITAELCRAKLDELFAAQTAIMAGQSYQMGDRQLTRASLPVIADLITEWDARLTKLEQGGTGGVSVRGIGISR